MSGIRFVEYITIPVQAGSDPEERKPINLWALIAFKSTGNLAGDHLLRLVLRTPKRKKAILKEFPMTFDDKVTGFNHRIKIDLKIKSQGTFWVDVILDGKRYTSMPLRVSFTEIQSTSPNEVA